ncbi:MAG: cytochrome C [Opitutus sp.]|nr:cytochrome C [Opitutus sp.]
MLPPPTHFYLLAPRGVRFVVGSLATLVSLLFLSGCGSKEEAEQAAKASPGPAELAANQPEVHGIEIKHVELTHPLKPEWVSAGKGIYEMKCLACHKLTNEKIVGPGWAGVTKRRQPLWIMNMITNVDMMLATDEEAQKLLELCLVRMPNMNVSADEARHLLEFMRHNDGEP